ncbi:MAG: acyltransferase [Chitinimonas sp.]|nr:acyltransferase [Chitinimonas sp.]
MTAYPGQNATGVTLLRNDWIDVLRGWAAIAVVLMHLNIRVPFRDFEGAAWLSKRAYNFLFSSGWQAVMVFFVISGFLITQAMLARWHSLDKVQPLQFYGFRAARLLPCLLGFIVLQSLLQAWQIPGFHDAANTTPLWRAMVSALTFHLNWLEAQYGYLPGAWDVLWSLSVEEAFYLGFPLLCLLVRSPRWLVAILCAFLIIGPYARVGMGSNEIWADHGYFSGMGEIALGFMLAMLARHWTPTGRRGVWVLVLGLVCMALPLYFRGWVYKSGLTGLGLDMTLLALGAALVLMATHANPAWYRYASLPGISWLRWVGRSSYEVYLCHMFVVIALVEAFRAWGGGPQMVPWLYGGALGLSLLAGHLVARYFSEPLNQRIRSRLVRGRSVVPAVAAQG